MDTLQILALASVAVAMANIADRLMQRRGALWWFPSGSGLIACLALVGLASVGVLLGWLSPSAMSLIAAPLFICQQLGSIWMRHASPTAVA